MFRHSTVLEKQIGWGVITFLIYNLVVGWKIALLIMVAVGFHEACHLWAARRLGLQTGGFYFLPFVGGISIIGKYERLNQQAFVVLAGPVGGGALAFLTYCAYLMTGSHHVFLGYAACWMGLLNLFNLLPLSMMDGGQIMNTISYSINRKLGFVLQLISTIAAIPLIWQLKPILSIVVAVLGLPPLLTEYRNQKNYQDKSWLCTDAYLNLPTSMSIREVLLTAGCWIAAAGVLSWLVLTLKEFNPF